MAVFSPMSLTLGAGSEPRANFKAASNVNAFNASAAAMDRSAQMAMLRKKLQAEERARLEEFGFRREQSDRDSAERAAERNMRSQETAAERASREALANREFGFRESRAAKDDSRYAGEMQYKQGRDAQLDSLNAKKMELDVAAQQARTDQERERIAIARKQVDDQAAARAEELAFKRDETEMGREERAEVRSADPKFIQGKFMAGRLAKALGMAGPEAAAQGGFPSYEADDFVNYEAGGMPTDEGGPGAGLDDATREMLGMSPSWKRNMERQKAELEIAALKRNAEGLPSAAEEKSTVHKVNMRARELLEQGLVDTPEQAREEAAMEANVDPEKVALPSLSTSRAATTARLSKFGGAEKLARESYDKAVEKQLPSAWWGGQYAPLAWLNKQVVKKVPRWMGYGPNEEEMASMRASLKRQGVSDQDIEFILANGLEE